MRGFVYISLEDGHIEKSRGFRSGKDGGHLSFLMNARQFSCSIVNNFLLLKMRFGNLLFFIFLRRIFDLNNLFSFCFFVRSCCFLNLKGYILRFSALMFLRSLPFLLIYSLTFLDFCRFFLLRF